MGHHCKHRRWLWPSLIAACFVAISSTSWAWETHEHQELGTASYLAACAQIAAVVDAPGYADGRARTRFELACGRNMPALAQLYGDGTAIAGDFVGHPSELLSPEGAWRFSSPKHYYLLALENSAHFNPKAALSWREYHEDAVSRALAAAAAEGLPQLDALEQVMRESAFADHVLQDSFAAGHMGFNRRASAASAAKRFHDVWNARGRVAGDRDGNTWTTYGDGRLDAPANQEGRRHVIRAATISVHDVMATFVFGKPHPEQGIAAWRALPFTIEAPALLVDAESLFEERRTGRDTGQVPLIATIVPARKNTVINAKIWSAAPFSHSGDPIVAASADVELAVPVLPAQALLGAGGTFREPGAAEPSALLEFGLLAPLGLSIEGLWSHEIQAEAKLIFTKDLTTIVHVEYEGSLELGTTLISAHLGIAEFFPERRTGWYAGLGFGFVLSAAGGGAL